MISLFLMGSKGLAVLNGIINKYGSNVISLVVGAEDKNVVLDYYDDIKELSLRHNIKFINRKESYKINTHYAMAISWRWLIKLDKNQLIILHDSLLPKYRGFAPLVNCLINGEEQIGVTALFATDKFDEGDIILQQKIEISYPIKISDAIRRIETLYVNIVLELLEEIKNDNKLMAYPQSNDDATYSLWLDEEDYHIKWELPAEQIERFINAVGYPYKGAYTIIEEIKVRVLNSQALPDLKFENRIPGKVIFLIDEKPVVVCGKGLLMINKLQYYSNDSTFQLKKLRTRFK